MPHQLLAALEATELAIQRLHTASEKLTCTAKTALEHLGSVRTEAAVAIVMALMTKPLPPSPPPEKDLTPEPLLPPKVVPQQQLPLELVTTPYVRQDVWGEYVNFSKELEYIPPLLEEPAPEPAPMLIPGYSREYIWDNNSVFDKYHYDAWDNDYDEEDIQRNLEQMRAELDASSEDVPSEVPSEVPPAVEDFTEKKVAFSPLTTTIPTKPRYNYNHEFWPSPRARNFAKTLRLKCRSHEDSLRCLALRAGITVEQLLQMNPLVYEDKYMYPLRVLLGGKVLDNLRGSLPEGVVIRRPHHRSYWY